MGYFAQNIAFCHKENMMIAFDEYYKGQKKRLDYKQTKEKTCRNILKNIHGKIIPYFS